MTTLDIFASSLHDNVRQRIAKRFQQQNDSENESDVPQQQMRGYSRRGRIRRLNEIKPLQIFVNFEADQRDFEADVENDENPSNRGAKPHDPCVVDDSVGIILRLRQKRDGFLQTRANFEGKPQANETRGNGHRYFVQVNDHPYERLLFAVQVLGACLK